MSKKRKDKNYHRPAPENDGRFEYKYLTDKTLSAGILDEYLISMRNSIDPIVINVPGEYLGLPVRRFEIDFDHNISFFARRDLDELGLIRPFHDRAALRISKETREVDIWPPARNDKFLNRVVVTVDPENPYLTCEDNIIYSKDKSRIVRFLNMDIERFEVPRGVKIIEKDAFRNMPIQEVILPPETRLIGETAFYNSKLKRINLENVRKIRRSAFGFCEKLDDIRLTCAEIEQTAFEYCGSLSRVVLENTRVIGDQAFMGCALTEIEFPESIEMIKHNVFYGCGIKRKSLPCGLRSAGSFSLYCDELELFLTEHFPLDPKRSNLGLATNSLITFRSPETGEVLFKLVNFETCDEWLPASYDYFSPKGVDLAKYDKAFMNEEYNDDPEIIFAKFNAAVCRLEYPAELTEKMRGIYERFIKEHAAGALKYIVSIREEEVRGFGHFGDISDRDFSDIIKLAVKKDDPELTAILLQKQREFGKYSTDDADDF